MSGQSVTLSAAVQTGSGTGPSGSSRSWMANTLSTMAIANGAAHLAVSLLAVGSHSITSKYSGDTNFSASAYPALTETVNPASTTTAIAASPNPATFAQSPIMSTSLSRLTEETGRRQAFLFVRSIT
jgi:large repetitive protein